MRLGRSILILIAALSLGRAALAGADDPSGHFARWLVGVRRKIAHAAAVAPKGFRGSAIVVVGFTVDRDGRVIASGVRQSSGHAVVDVAGLRAVARAAPFAPIPGDSGRTEAFIAVPLRYF